MALVRDVMTKSVETLRTYQSIREAAARMRDLDVGSIPIEENNEIVGILTDRDITVRGVAEGKDPDATKVTEIMTVKPLTVYDDQKLEQAAEVMEKNRIRRVVVLDRKDRLVGILAQGDIARHDGNQKLTAELVEKVSQPAE